MVWSSSSDSYSLHTGQHEGKAHISAEHSAPEEDARLQSSNGYEKRPYRPEATANQGTQAFDSLRRIIDVALLGLAPIERVRRRSDFERAYASGVRIPARYMTLFVVSNGGPVSRLGIAASRKFGAAVERNRAKRLSREVFRRHKITTGLDVVIVPRRGMLDASFSSLEIDYAEALDRRHRGQPAASRPARRPSRSRPPTRL